MNLSGKIEEEVKEEAPAKKKQRNLKDKKGSSTTNAKKGASKTLKGSSGTKHADKKAGKASGKYEVRIMNAESSNEEDEEDPKKQKKEGSSEDDEEAEERKKRKNLKEIAMYDIKS